jgi:hypothetical protein
MLLQLSQDNFRGNDRGHDHELLPSIHIDRNDGCVSCERDCRLEISNWHNRSGLDQCHRSRTSGWCNSGHWGLRCSILSTDGLDEICPYAKLPAYEDLNEDKNSTESDQSVDGGNDISTGCDNTNDNNTANYMVI